MYRKKLWRCLRTPRSDTRLHIVAYIDQICSCYPGSLRRHSSYPLLETWKFWSGWDGTQEDVRTVPVQQDQRGLAQWNHSSWTKEMDWVPWLYMLKVHVMFDSTKGDDQEQPAVGPEAGLDSNQWSTWQGRMENTNRPGIRIPEQTAATEHYVWLNYCSGQGRVTPKKNHINFSW